MHHKKVKSSLLDTMAYEPITQHLEVTFKNGKKYVYAGVPAKVYEQVMASRSVGKAFHTLVRKGDYEHKQVGGGNA